MLHTDAFAWYMEQDPVLRSTVVAVALLDRAPDWDYLRRRIDRLTRQVPPLRQRVQEPPLRMGPPRWVTDQSFDLDYHLRRVRLPAPAGWASVLEFARVAAMADFDRARPLWEFTLLEGMPEGRTAFVTKLHHALADGIGGLEIAALALDLSAQMPPIGDLASVDAPPPLGTRDLVLRSLRDNTTEAAALTSRIGRALPGTTLRSLRDPVGAAQIAIATTASVGRIVRPILRAASPVMTERMMVRRLYTLDVPLTPLKAAAKASGGHLNDAFLAAITGGLRRYHQRHGDALDQLRVTMPLSVRRPDDPVGGNRITLLRFPLPVGVQDPAERLRRISRIVTSWRHEPAIPLTQGIAFGLNLAPRSFIQGILRRVDFVASDVPGLTDPV
jgi:WS/DGAT/MGAT family acyltransferase